MLYQFAHGVNANIIADRFNVGVFTMYKYVDIVVDALIFKDKLFNQYIFIPHDLDLLTIMDGIFYAHGLPNVYGTMDRSHIFLSQKLDKKVIIIFVDYYYRQKML
jgi:hypothetical protein